MAASTSGKARTLVCQVRERKHTENHLKFRSLINLLGSEEAAWRALQDGRKNVTMHRSLRAVKIREVTR